MVQYKFLCWLAGEIFKRIHILDQQPIIFEKKMELFDVEANID